MKFQINEDEEKTWFHREKTWHSPEWEWPDTSQWQVEAGGQWRNVFKILREKDKTSNLELYTYQIINQKWG